MKIAGRIVLSGMLLCMGLLPAFAQQATDTVSAPPVDSLGMQPADTLQLPDTIQPVQKSPRDRAAEMQEKALAQAAAAADTAVYQGTTVRVDILNPVFEMIRSGWHTYSIEAAVNVRLKNRFFPTLEGGYAGRFLQEKDAATPLYDGSGEFVRIGLDINPLKKHPEQRSCLLIGVRGGTAWQRLRTPALTAVTPQGKCIADAWGEIVAGVQVDIAKGFNMGWAVRMKFLFTTNAHDELTTPYYIPGFGYRNTMNWGFDYYLGYTF
ncbi:MAG: hypothetical protein IJT12_08725 [Paludibacteraceae bacterium]|nr:hypothetical protein [Paludibacteraceae bacterium]